jgi:hypothetical protein
MQMNLLLIFMEKVMKILYKIKLKIKKMNHLFLNLILMLFNIHDKFKNFASLLNLVFYIFNHIIIIIFSFY